jgi:hypothetical protein
MTLSQQDALSALKDIEHAQGRATQARGYAHASPHLIIWGLVTLVCYGLADFLPSQGDLAWGAGSVLGTIASVYVGSRAGKAEEGWRYLGSFLALVVFVLAACFVLPPTTADAGSAFISLVVAVAYVLMGIWSGVRILVTGLLMAALTMGGYLTIHQHFQLYMGVVTGGALILAGLWLRRV